MIVFLAGVPARVRDCPNAHLYEHVLFSQAVNLKRDIRWLFAKKRLEIVEIWKPFPDNPGYQISSRGRVRSKDRLVQRKNHAPQPWKGKVLSLFQRDDGYMTCTIKDKMYWIAPIVCRLFNGSKPSPEHEVNHKDGDKTNNRWDNLEWVTSSQNKKHAIALGLSKPWLNLMRKKKELKNERHQRKAAARS